MQKIIVQAKNFQYETIIQKNYHVGDKITSINGTCKIVKILNSSTPIYFIELSK